MTVSKPNEIEFEIMQKLTERDADVVKDSPCFVCGRKSVARMRCYSEEDLGQFRLIAVCRDHISIIRGVMNDA